MTAPAAVDLSLPTDRELLAAASPNPETEAARLTRSGNPGLVRGVGQQLMAAGEDLDEVYRQSQRAQRELAGGLSADGAPGYDAELHVRRLPPGFRDAGTRLHDQGRRLGAVADDLDSAITEVTALLDRLRGELHARRLAFAAQVDAARTTDGRIPVEAVAELQARRAGVAGEMQLAATVCGRDVSARIGRYNEVLGGCRPLLGELVAVGTAAGAVDIRGTWPQAILGGRFEASTPAPPTPTMETIPIPEPRPREPRFTPAPAGLGPLITLPAPGLGTGRRDGPGSGQRVVRPPIQIDRDTGIGAEPPSQPRIHPGQQGKHTPGHPNYRPGRSVLMVDPAALLEQVGTGEQVGPIPHGQPGHRERIDYGLIIGEHIDEADGVSRPTSIGIVHHRADGSVHIVPGRPR